MSIVSLLGVKVLNNPAPWTDKYEFEITFECLESLSKDLEWKVIYVGSATDSKQDQELDSILVGPVPIGINKFILSADAPTLDRINNEEILGVTVVLLVGSYDSREFVRVGYYVNNEYDSEELNNELPSTVQVGRIVRNMLVDKPRVTKFNIVWDNPNDPSAAEFPPDQPDADLAPDDEEKYAAEEIQEEAAALAEHAAGPAAGDNTTVDHEGDAAMGDGEEQGKAGEEEDDEEEDGGDESEDLEGESDEDEEEEDGEGEAEEDGGDGMEIEPSEAPAPGPGTHGHQAPISVS